MHFQKTHQIYLSIQPHELGHIEQAISKCLQQLVGTSNEVDGFLLQIIELIQYENIKISPHTGNCLYQVQFKSLHMRPQFNVQYTCIITQIVPNGIFASSDGLNISIHKNRLPNWTYYKTTSGGGGFINGETTLNLGDWIVVQIVDMTYKGMKYTNHGFRCIGQLVHTHPPQSV